MNAIQTSSSNASGTTPRSRIEALRAALKAAFQERDGVVDALLAAVIAGEHVVMLGPPGTGKSAIARALCGAVGDARYYEWLLTRFTEPNELFGGIDLPKWTSGGAYERQGAGMLQEAHIAFLDEVFKANSSILNALLTIINERVFHDGGKVRSVPLQTVVAASNELPEGPELEALYDRFLVRLQVDYVVNEDAFFAIVSGAAPAVPVLLDLATLEAARAEAAAIPLASGLLKALFDLRAELAKDGIKASDRRWKKLLQLVRAQAYLSGDAEADALHFEVLKHGLWRDPREISKVNQAVVKTASPLLLEATGVFDAIMEQVNGLPREINAGNAAALVKELKIAVRKLEGYAAQGTPAVAQRIKALHGALEAERTRIAGAVAKALGL